MQENSQSRDGTSKRKSPFPSNNERMKFARGEDIVSGDDSILTEHTNAQSPRIAPHQQDSDSAVESCNVDDDQEHFLGQKIPPLETVNDESNPDKEGTVAKMLKILSKAPDLPDLTSGESDLSDLSDLSDMDIDHLDQLQGSEDGNQEMTNLEGSEDSEVGIQSTTATATSFEDQDEATRKDIQALQELWPLSIMDWPPAALKITSVPSFGQYSCEENDGMSYECTDDNCFKSAEDCTNRGVANLTRQDPKVEIFHTGTEKGYGLRATRDIEKQEYVVEYQGEPKRRVSKEETVRLLYCTLGYSD